MQMQKVVSDVKLHTATAYFIIPLTVSFTNYLILMFAPGITKIL
jgi:hypothetical protein